jgi:hypothetical protein
VSHHFHADLYERFLLVELVQRVDNIKRGWFWGTRVLESVKPLVFLQLCGTGSFIVLGVETALDEALGLG